MLHLRFTFVHLLNNTNTLACGLFLIGYEIVLTRRSTREIEAFLNPTTVLVLLTPPDNSKYAFNAWEDHVLRGSRRQ